MRIEISPEPTPEERAVIEAVVARIYSHARDAAINGRDYIRRYAAMNGRDYRSLRLSWRELARLEALDDDVQKDPRR